MHELSVCRSLLHQVREIAVGQGACRVRRIHVRIGALAGVEPQLLQQVFPLALSGALFGQTELAVETAPVRVHCPRCNEESAAASNCLRCGVCGHWRTRLVSGDEMLLTHVELVMEEGGDV